MQEMYQDIIALESSREAWEEGDEISLWLEDYETPLKFSLWYNVGELGLSSFILRSIYGVSFIVADFETEGLFPPHFL